MNGFDCRQKEKNNNIITSKMRMGPCRRGEVKEWGKIQKNNRFSNTE